MATTSDTGIRRMNISVGSIVPNICCNFSFIGVYVCAKILKTLNSAKWRTEKQSAIFV